MGPFALAEDEHQLVLRAIEASHAAVVLDPHAQVEEIVVVLLAGGKARIREMDFRYVEETDQNAQALLEIYCTLTLNARFNDFNTH